MEINLENIYKTLYANDEIKIKPQSFLSDMEYNLNNSGSFILFNKEESNRLITFLNECKQFHYIKHSNEFKFRGTIKDINTWVKNNVTPSEKQLLDYQKDVSIKANMIIEAAISNITGSSTKQESDEAIDIER